MTDVHFESCMMEARAWLWWPTFYEDWRPGGVLEVVPSPAVWPIILAEIPSSQLLGHLRSARRAQGDVAISVATSRCQVCIFITKNYKKIDPMLGPLVYGYRGLLEDSVFDQLKADMAAAACTVSTPPSPAQPSPAYQSIRAGGGLALKNRGSSRLNSRRRLGVCRCMTG